MPFYVHWSNDVVTYSVQDHPDPSEAVRNHNPYESRDDAVAAAEASLAEWMPPQSGADMSNYIKDKPHVRNLVQRVSWAAFVFFIWLAVEIFWRLVFGYWQADISEVTTVITMLFVAVFTFPHVYKTEA